MKRTRLTTAAVAALFFLAMLLLAGLLAVGCSGDTVAPPQTTAAQPTTSAVQVPSSGASPSTSEAPSATSEAQPPTSAAQPTTTVPASPAYVTVDVQQAYERLQADPEAQMVDVREPAEWAATGVPVGAALIPLGSLEQRAPGELAEDKPVYVICRSGNRSRTGSEILLGLGFTEVYNVDGGIQAWMKAGLPVKAYEG